MMAEPSPGMDEINWQALWAGYTSRLIRLWGSLLPLLIVILFPIGVLTGEEAWDGGALGCF